MHVTQEIYRAYDAYHKEGRATDNLPVLFSQFAHIFELGQKSVIDKVMSYSDDTTAHYIKSQLNPDQ